ncbi:MAG: hypothetical protein RIG56_23270 [Thalassobaculum sp.]
MAGVTDLVPDAFTIRAVLGPWLPFTVLSCDNLSGNGEVTANILRTDAVLLSVREVFGDDRPASEAFVGAVTAALDGLFDRGAWSGWGEGGRRNRGTGRWRRPRTRLLPVGVLFAQELDEERDRDVQADTMPFPGPDDRLLPSLQHRGNAGIRDDVGELAGLHVKLAPDAFPGAVVGEQSGGCGRFGEQRCASVRPQVGRRVHRRAGADPFTPLRPRPSA